MMAKTASALLFDDLPRARDPVLYICHDAEGIQIDQRKNDGYIDATAMCRAYGRRFNNYSQTDTFKEFAAALSAKTGIPVLGLVQTAIGGAHTGTWVHPQYAVRLAISISADFAVLVTGWVLDWMQGRQPAIHKDDIEPFVIGRLVQETHEMVAHIAAQTERVVDTTERTHERAERLEVRQQKMQLDLWRTLSDAPPKPFQPAPPRPPTGLPPLARPRKP